MIAEQRCADSMWSFDLARYGASPGVIAACCGRTHKWAKHLVEAAGGETAKKRVINRTESFEQGPDRKAHVHVVAMAYYALRGDMGAPERLARVYRAYRLVVRSAILTLDEVHELVFNVLDQRGGENWVCAKCEKTRYVVGSGGSCCAGCEDHELTVCAECEGKIRREPVRRGRPTRRCHACRGKRGRKGPRRARPARVAANSRRLRVVGLTSPDDTAPPTAPARTPAWPYAR